MAQQQIHDTKNKLEKAVLVGVHAQDDKQFNFESTMENYHLYQRLANLKCWVKLLKTEIV